MNSKQKDELVAKTLTPERWEVACNLLQGLDPSGLISPRAAAAAAGVPLSTFKLWIERSREQRPDDDAWVWEIAPVYDERFAAQGEALEDVLFQRFHKGEVTPIIMKDKTGNPLRIGEKVTYDNNLGLKLLRARDDRYKPAPKVQNNLVLLEEQGHAIREGLLALVRREEAKAHTLDAEYEQLPESDSPDQEGPGG